MTLQGLDQRNLHEQAELGPALEGPVLRKGQGNETDKLCKIITLVYCMCDKDDRWSHLESIQS